jgi:MOSC domain
VREAPLPHPSEAPGDALRACLATVLEIDLDAVPELEPGADAAASCRRWLAGRGLGPVSVAAAADFAWPGPWIGLLRPAGGGPPRAVVMYGVPSGVVFDPTGVADRDGWSVADGLVLAALDVALAAPPSPGPATGRGTVEAICLAARAEATVTEVAAARAQPGRGLEGDRHADGTGTFPSGVSGSALTLIDAAVLESFSPVLAPDEHRRNLVTRGLDLDALVGRTFTVGEVRCRGARACEPCAHLERVAGRPVLRALVHRGGLRADILSAGTIRVGDAVIPAG